MFQRSFVVTDTLAHVRFLLRWSIVACVFKPSKNKMRGVLELPHITGQDLLDVVRPKRSSAGGLDGWASNDLRALLLPWFSGVAILLYMIEATGAWPHGLLDAYDPQGRW